MKTALLAGALGVGTTGFIAGLVALLVWNTPLGGGLLVALVMSGAWYSLLTEPEDEDYDAGP